MCDKELLVGYLYDELSASDRAAFSAHLAGCAECREEVDALHRTRQHLAAWAPPEPTLDFRVIRGGAAAPARRSLSFVPAWGLAAAASLLLLAGAAALANLEVRYGQEGLIVRTGWGTGAPEQGVGERAASERTVQPQAATDSAASEELREMLLALQQRLRELEATTAQQPAEAPSVAPAVLSDRQRAAVAALASRLIAESEARQRTETALQITQVWRDFNATRAGDYMRFQQALGHAQGQTNYQLRQHRDSIDLLKVSLQK